MELVNFWVIFSAVIVGNVTTLLLLAILTSVFDDEGKDG